jgi:hypothetical protein
MLVRLIIFIVGYVLLIIVGDMLGISISPPLERVIDLRAITIRISPIAIIALFKMGHYALEAVAENVFARTEKNSLSS